jgi:hypothetical protein
MFELADTLCGVYKTGDTTKTLAIEPMKLFGSIIGELPGVGVGVG